MNHPELFNGYHHATLIVGCLDVGAGIPFHTGTVLFPFVFRMGRQPLAEESVKLLLKGFYAAGEVNFQPFAAWNGEQAHSFGHVASFVSSADE